MEVEVAVFQWNGKERRFIPVKGLMYSKYAEHEPAWVTFAVIESVMHGQFDRVAAHVAAHRGCDDPKSLYKLLRIEKWSSIGRVKLLRKSRLEAQIP